MNSEINKKQQAATSIGSLVLSFLASSHHWIHMVILLAMGGSMSMAMGGTMPAVVWFRRLMILFTVITVGYSIYRLLRHKNMDRRIVGFTVASSVISVGLVIFTLIQFGW